MRSVLLPADATTLFLHPIALDSTAGGFLGIPGLVCPTLPGFGERAAPRGLTLDDLADAIAAEAEGPLHVIGCSMGGMVAMHLALRFPELVASLVLAYTTARTDPAALQARADETERAGSAAMAMPTMRRWFSPAVLERTPYAEPVSYALDRLRRTAAVRIADGWRAIAGQDVLAELGRLGDVPVTCIAGRRDLSNPLAAMEAVAAAIPHARLVVADHPHMGFLEDPQGFSALLSDHFTRIDEGRR